MKPIVDHPARPAWPAWFGICCSTAFRAPSLSSLVRDLLQRSFSRAQPVQLGSGSVVVQLFARPACPAWFGICCSTAFRAPSLSSLVRDLLQHSFSRAQPVQLGSGSVAVQLFARPACPAWFVICCSAAFRAPSLSSLVRDLLQYSFSRAQPVQLGSGSVAVQLLAHFNPSPAHPLYLSFALTIMAPSECHGTAYPRGFPLQSVIQNKKLLVDRLPVTKLMWHARQTKARNSFIAKESHALVTKAINSSRFIIKQVTRCDP